MWVEQFKWIAIETFAGNASSLENDLLRLLKPGYAKWLIQILLSAQSLQLVLTRLVYFYFFVECVSPICLPSTSEIGHSFEGEMMIFSGWGYEWDNPTEIPQVLLNCALLADKT